MSAFRTIIRSGDYDLDQSNSIGHDDHESAVDYATRLLATYTDTTPYVAVRNLATGDENQVERSPETFTTFGYSPIHMTSSFRWQTHMIGDFTDLEAAKEHAMRLVQNGVYHRATVKAYRYNPRSSETVFEFIPKTIFSWYRETEPMA